MESESQARLSDRATNTFTFHFHTLEKEMATHSSVLAHQAPMPLGFSRQEHWSGLPFPSPGDLPDPGIDPRSPALQADALTSKEYIFHIFTHCY